MVDRMQGCLRESGGRGSAAAQMFVLTSVTSIPVGEWCLGRLWYTTAATLVNRVPSGSTAKDGGVERFLTHPPCAEKSCQGTFALVGMWGGGRRGNCPPKYSLKTLLPKKKSTPQYGTSSSNTSKSMLL